MIFYRGKQLALPVLVLALIVGCAAERKIETDAAKGLDLVYRIPDSQVLKYQTSSKSTQKLEMFGQSVEVRTDGASGFSVQSKGVKAGSQSLAVTLESFSLVVTSPRGELAADAKNAVGKTFTMNLSPLGKESDLAEAEAIQYELGPAGKRSIAPGFQAVFPDMAGKPLKIGETWTVTDTVREKAAEGETVIAIESVNTLVGTETFEGHECVKITAVFTGSVSGRARQGGMDFVTKGTVKGVDTTYFAHKEGFLVKNVSTGTAKTVSEASGAQSITIPATREFRNETRLISGR